MPEVRISTLDVNRINELADFSRQIHPRLIDARKRISWFLLGTPFLEEIENTPALITLDTDGRIAGQFMLNDQEWYYKNLKYRGVFGYDFFIAEDHRRSGMGALLLFKAVRGERVFFGVGLTPAAEKLYEAAKIKKIGVLKKFLWVNKPFSSAGHVLSYMFKWNGEISGSNCDKVFPAKAFACSLVFKLIQEPPVEKYNPYYDPDVIEFSRSTGFLRWRFFDSDIKYYFYYCSDYDVPLFFVVRPVLRKGLKLLSLVDYKSPVRDGKALGSILKAAKSIARVMGFDGLVSAGSYESINKAFAKEGFLPVGKPAPIVSTFRDDPLTGDNPDVEVCITMADADLDLNFGDDQ